MLVIAHHNILDPEKFWSTAQSLTSSMPSDLKLHRVFPPTDMEKGTCVWEASSIEDVQKFMDEGVGDVSTNTFYEVNEAAAMGAPKIAMEATV